MRCSRIREALSARLDSEDPGVPADRIDAHLAACGDCRSWADAVGSLPHALGEPSLRKVALDPAVLAALLEEARPQRQPVLLDLWGWRTALTILAAIQLVTAWLGVAAGAGHASVHAAHELTSWDLGLAVGFLYLAWRPSRAWGALPLVAVLVAFLAGSSVLDLASGDASLARESVHLLEVAGLLCVWMVARAVPRPSVVLRLA